MEAIKDAKGKTIAVKFTWGTDDVLQTAKQHGIRLTDNQVSEVLDRMLEYHDANIGMSWEVILYHIDCVKGG